MSSIVAKTILGAVAAVVLCGAAQAADFDAAVRVAPYGSPHRFVDGDNGPDNDDNIGGGRPWSTERREDFRERDHRHWRFGHDWGPGRGRPVFARPGWDRYEEECRVVVKRRTNPWGGVVVQRTRICG